MRQDVKRWWFDSWRVIVLTFLAVLLADRFGGWTQALVIVACVPIIVSILKYWKPKK